MATTVPRAHPFASHLPLTRLSVRSGPVTLRVPDQVELAAYCDRLAAGGLDDDETHATLKWQPSSPEAAATQTLAHVSEAATRGPGPDWLLPLFVFVDGEPIGRQDLAADGRFAQLQQVKTASVLLNTHRRRGFGTRARAGALALAWELGATRALTAWRTGNAASARVSEKLGYLPEGSGRWWDERAGRAVEVRRASVDPERFRSAWPEPVEVTGVDDAARAWVR